MALDTHGSAVLEAVVASKLIRNVMIELHPKGEGAVAALAFFKAVARARCLAAGSGAGKSNVACGP